MSEYRIISVCTHDIVLEYGYINIPIKGISCSTKYEFDDDIIVPSRRYYKLGIETYPIDKNNIKKVLSHIEESKLIVYDTYENSDYRNPILEFRSFIPTSKILCDFDNNNKIIFRFKLIAMERIPS